MAAQGPFVESTPVQIDILEIPRIFNIMYQYFIFFIKHAFSPRNTGTSGDDINTRSQPQIQSGMWNISIALTYLIPYRI